MITRRDLEVLHDMLSSGVIKPEDVAARVTLSMTEEDHKLLLELVEEFQANITIREIKEKHLNLDQVAHECQEYLKAQGVPSSAFQVPSIVDTDTQMHLIKREFDRVLHYARIFIENQHLDRIITVSSKWDTRALDLGTGNIIRYHIIRYHIVLDVPSLKQSQYLIWELKLKKP